MKKILIVSIIAVSGIAGALYAAAKAVTLTQSVTVTNVTIYSDGRCVVAYTRTFKEDDQLVSFGTAEFHSEYKDLILAEAVSAANKLAGAE